MSPELVFAHPGLLLAAGAAAIPVLIHLLLRPRPRRARFPALSLLRAALASGQRARRFRNLLLLALRGLLVALAALLAAGPTCVQRSGPFVSDQPLACAVLLDDSVSMSYQPERERTLLDLAQAAAAGFVQAAATWPPGSQVAFLRAGSAAEPPRWTGEPLALAGQIRTAPTPTPHARPLGAALQAAAELLRKTDAARRLVIFTDGTAAAWRDVTPGILADIPGLAIRVTVAGDEPRSNLAVTAAAGPAHLHPAAAPVPVRVELAGAGIATQAWLAAADQGRTLARQGPIALAADSTSQLELELPAAEPGPHAATIQLEPPDRMNFDQQRFVAWQAGPRPRVWLTGPSEAPAGRSQEDLTALLLRNLLAPESLPAAQQLLELHVVPGDELPAWLAGNPDRPALVVALSGAVPAEAAGALLELAQRGSALLLIPSSAAGAGDWPVLRSRLCPSPPVLEELPDPAAIHWETGTVAADQPGLAELTRSAVYRRLRLEHVAAGAVAEAVFSDGAPAIVSRRLDRGRLLLLATSPDPQWSDLGIRAAGLITWLHELAGQAAGGVSAIASFLVGEATRQPLPALPPAALVRIVPPAGEPLWIRLKEGIPERPWPTPQPGIYTLQLAGSERPAAMYVVNWPPEESRLERIELARLRDLLGTSTVELEATGVSAASERADSRTRWLADPARVVAALLLLVFGLELLLSGRARRVRLE